MNQTLSRAETIIGTARAASPNLADSAKLGSGLSPTASKMRSKIGSSSRPEYCFCPGQWRQRRPLETQTPHITSPVRWLLLFRHTAHHHHRAPPSGYSFRFQGHHTRSTTSVPAPTDRLSLTAWATAFSFFLTRPHSTVPEGTGGGGGRTDAGAAWCPGNTNSRRALTYGAANRFKFFKRDPSDDANRIVFCL